jgi:hypothetical protein
LVRALATSRFTVTTLTVARLRRLRVATVSKFGICPINGVQWTVLLGNQGHPTCCHIHDLHRPQTIDGDNCAVIRRPTHIPDRIDILGDDNRTVIRRPTRRDLVASNLITSGGVLDDDAAITRR